MSEFAPWLALAGLGAYHGVNPAMGWLFAVSLGLQERRRAAVHAAFIPIALGHTASVAAVVAVVVLVGVIVPLVALKVVGAAVVIGFGVFKLLKPLSHPRWVRMRVGFRALTAWSFLMSSAHGAGLMLVPILFTLPLLGLSSDGIDLRELEHAEYMSLGRAAEHRHAGVATDCGGNSHGSDVLRHGGNGSCGLREGRACDIAARVVQPR